MSDTARTVLSCKIHNINPWRFLIKICIYLPTNESNYLSPSYRNINNCWLNTTALSNQMQILSSQYEICFWHEIMYESSSSKLAYFHSNSTWRVILMSTVAWYTCTNYMCSNSTVGSELIFILTVQVCIHMDKSDSLRALAQIHLITHWSNILQKDSPS